MSVSRYALNEMDKFSLKDSGRGDSEAGDSDCEMGRESPLLGEGFGELFTPDGHHRLHPCKHKSVMLIKVLSLHSAFQSNAIEEPFSVPQRTIYTNVAIICITFLLTFYHLKYL